MKEKRSEKNNEEKKCPSLLKCGLREFKERLRTDGKIVRAGTNDEACRILSHYMLRAAMMEAILAVTVEEMEKGVQANYISGACATLSRFLLTRSPTEAPNSQKPTWTLERISQAHGSAASAIVQRIALHDYNKIGAATTKPCLLSCFSASPGEKTKSELSHFPT